MFPRRRLPKGPRVVAAFAALTAGLLAPSVEAAPVASNPKVVFRHLVDASEVVSIVGLTDGTIRYAERATGNVWDIDRREGSKPQRRATLPVRIDGQRGLLGLAIDGKQRTFASWVGKDGVLVVGQILAGPQRVVWRGPATTEKANGGHLVIDSDNRHLLIGIGDLLQGHQQGRLLRIDPDAEADQQPVLLSTGWNNPFAFDRAGAAVWVADNSPGSAPERIGRGDGTIVGQLAIKTAPSGLAVLNQRPKPVLATCGFVSHRLDLLTLPAAESPSTRLTASEPPLATDCLTAVTLLPDRRIAYATATGINISQQPFPSTS